MAFINDNFMFTSKTGKRLYEKYAKNLPIIDYHCHLSPELIAKNYKFKNAYDLFLSGDHYKWRQMRSDGVDEKYITGDAEDYDKFLAFARVLPRLIGNPLFHWTQLELKRYFGISEILCEDNARDIYAIVTELLQRDEYSAQNLIINSNVEAVCTTDDPLDTLEYHKQLKDFKVKILPTFRPDKAVEINKDGWREYIEKTGAESFDGLLSWLTSRIEFFAEMGCKLADHGVDYVPFKSGDADAVFKKKMAGDVISADENDIFRTAVMLHCGREYARLGFAMQLHMGAIRNNSVKMFEKLGADVGLDSVNDPRIAESLSGFLNELDYTDELPKTILYTLNPKDNYVLGTMIGNFQRAPVRGKIQFGSGWWFNDQRDGMTEQMKALANLGMLANFVDMLTDSRSFVSYTRHEYFRRIMCNLIGTWVDNGEYPCDERLLSVIVSDIAYNNAKRYFGF